MHFQLYFVLGDNSDESPAHSKELLDSVVGIASRERFLRLDSVPAELHVYQNGGNGYGIRDRPDSVISSWPARATDWLRLRRLLVPEK